MPKKKRPQAKMTPEELEETLLIMGENIKWPTFHYIPETKCRICGHDFSSPKNYDRHLNTAKHEKMAKRHHDAIDMAKESGFYDSFREAWSDYADRLLSITSDERHAKYEAAKTATQAIVSYWRIQNSAGPATARSAPPISL